MALIAPIGGNGQLFVGEDKTFTLEVLDSDPDKNPAAAPVDMSVGWTVVFDVRLRDNSVDPPIFTKPASIIGIFAPTRPANTQRAQTTLSDDEMNTIRAGIYRHSWKRTDEGFETVLAWGDFTPQKATAP